MRSVTLFTGLLPTFSVDQEIFLTFFYL